MEGPEVSVPRYFFDITDRSAEFKDDTGVEFATVEEAKAEGATALARMMAEAVRGPSDHIMYIVVRDEARQPIAQVMLSLTMRDGADRSG